MYGHTPKTKEITDKMEKNVEEQNKIWDKTVTEYKEKHNLSQLNSNGLKKVLEMTAANPNLTALKRDLYRIERDELVPQIVADLGLPVTKKTIGYVAEILNMTSFVEQ